MPTAVDSQRTLTIPQKRPLVDEYWLRPSKQACYGQVGGFQSGAVEQTTSSIRRTVTIPNVLKDNEERQNICYGMFVDPSIEVTREQSGHPILVDLNPDGQTLIEVDVDGQERAVGTLRRKSVEILKTLQKGSSLSLQYFLRWISGSAYEGTFSCGKEDRATSQPRWSLFVNLYGPTRLAEDVGSFAEACGICLQDPEHCDRNVQYCNPQKLPRDDGAIFYTQSLPRIEFTFGVEEIIENPFDLLASTEEDDSFSDAPLPPGLRTMLYRHQRRGLSWMSTRERGWDFDGHGRDIWKVEKFQGGLTRYVNRATGDWQLEAPADFRGGILADDMGLGKTLTVISLIVSDLSRSHSSAVLPQTRLSSIEGPKTTLLIVPLSLLQVWAHQIQHHVEPGILRYHVYYGRDRNRTQLELDQLDLVITTYSVVSKEFEKGLSSPYGPGQLHTTVWHRIVLDEAHAIRVHSTVSARAACALNAQRRWAVTGTPIQNRLSDLSSLFKFLRMSPFDEPQTFKRYVTQTWKSRSDPEAVARLKVLVNSVTLRRTKATISLPKRNDEIHVLEFEYEEAQLYEKIKAQTRQKIEELGDLLPSHTFLNALKWINDLRLVCNHGVAFEHSHIRYKPDNLTYEADTQPPTPCPDLRMNECPSPMRIDPHLDNVICEGNSATPASSACLSDSMDNTPISYQDPTSSVSDSPQPEEEWNKISANMIFRDLVVSGLANCSGCLTDLSYTKRSNGSMQHSNIHRISKSHLLCALCFTEKALPTEKYFAISPSPPRDEQKYLDPRYFSSSSRSSGAATPNVEIGPTLVSTKIKTLVNDLSRRPPGEKSVVFSYWTRTLDMVQRQLGVAGINFARLDGSMSSSVRGSAIRSFQTDHEITVFLVSITCGGLGLDLTAANKAYIMEPQWNPMIEEQALDRIHRLGQNKEVTTVRYVIRGSFEENVRTIQKRKKDLAQLAFQEAPLKKEDLTYGRLQYLKDLVG
ncbi:hypothetical protein GJ744_008279 [Endocarpon pusillum]|uniref:Uncharacterized protein n=1 Tax=Endocarpon pusillum TaxID=364733 RepID=A0A8H7AJC7_9EURO|nr:hypothetical protein GJ744_008279 [Endocarpon pusillum]